jgi:hypothetical protein
MSEESAVKDTIEVTDAGSRLDAVVAHVQQSGNRVRVEKGGTLVAAVVSSEDLRRLDQLDADRAERFKIIDEMRAAFKNVPFEELEREAERALAQVRNEMRREREQSSARAR